MTRQNKIQVETVKIEANAEVIVLNTSFVAKAMRAQFALREAMDKMISSSEEMCKLPMSFLNELVDALLGEEESVETQQTPAQQGEV